ncbi:AraC family transcriptional regulator ligand-binding domain-containing protein [Mycobacterium shinjukuense]|uniref:Putative HTH-type transcriptional regulator n=1 Tax=Mycobacterium shinjukuense TaxID=398694 RepID=A0A7I7MQ87_9MYCO|nr:AraC family transcriptional regulator [Mycobacterium shinjukuense]MCV6986454.1 AraC family transcriptional regulator ligand-binding domain-containing protein [Mycobacterium shinjukuense]ORB69023.1 AraC family transcriptional regulator [Mycobacterium shinjukuense]BBX73932.1 putative HTH-type transcriptional regulator [Mycobacterium shinjukuense]
MGAEVTHPVYATRVLCEVANERGVSTRDVLAGTGIEPADLDKPDTVVSARDEIAAVRRLLARLPDLPNKGAGVGIDVGSRFTLTHFGLFGFAVMSCGTLRELFAIAMRYFALTMLHIDVTLFETADDCVVDLDVGHLPADVQRFFLERDVAGIITTTMSFAQPVAEKYADRVSAEVAIDEQSLRPLLGLMPVHDIAFGRAHNRLHFPRAMFDEPLPQADRHTLEMCIAQCDVLMQRNEQRRGITALVRTKLFRDSGCFPTLPDVAAELAVHPRTLRRRLAEEGTSFRALLTEARSTVAVDLLRNVGLTVAEVSTRLGYTEVSTFSHAFKRWFGVAPSAYARRG